MTTRAAHFVGGFALLAGLAGCQDGKLDVLEPLPTAGTAGAAGASGNSSTGGSAAGGAGGAGMAGSGGASSLPSPFVLDDFEDGNTQSLIPEGYWYFEPDPTCSGSFGIEPVAGRPGNTHAVRARGGGCTAWGALLGLDLGGIGETFDSTSFDELRFWARAEPGSVTELSVSLLEPQHFDTVVDLTSEWREYVLPLDGFAFNDEGTEQPFDRNALTHLQFFVFSDGSFDFWLDDLAFVRSP